MDGGRRGGGGEGRREGGREGGREREGRREGEMEGGREGGKEGRREGGKEGRREGVYAIPSQESVRDEKQHIEFDRVVKPFRNFRQMRSEIFSSECVVGAAAYQ